MNLDLSTIYGLLSITAMGIAAWARWTLVRHINRVDGMDESVRTMQTDLAVMKAEIRGLPTAQMMSSQTDTLRESITLHSRDIYQRIGERDSHAQDREDRILARIDAVAQDVRRHSH